MIKNNDYWKKRELAEKTWQKANEKNLRAYNRKIAQMYQNATDSINRQIKADLAITNGKLVTAKGMQEYETLAKQAVEKANALRAAGHHVTRKDFSKDVNDRLKIYNATMRINRNEMLKSKIGAHLVNLGVEQESSLSSELWDDYTKEKERQAGILGITAKSNLWTSKEVVGQVYKQVAGANFSKRIWADIDGLKGQLDGLLSTALIRGESPEKMAKWLTGMVSATVGNQKYVAERLARTETARVQFTAQKTSILDNGYKYVKWIAEGSACKLCREIAYKDNGYDEDGVYKAKDVPDIPVHPNCMCSISAHWVENDKIKVDNKIDDISSMSDFTQAVKSLGFTTVKGMNGIDLDNLKIIYKTVANNFASHPELKGYLTTLQGRTRRRSNAVAWVSSGMVSNGEGGLKADVSLNINKPFLNDFSSTVERCVKDGWWTKKENYSGVINHELAHAIEGRANFEEYKLDHQHIENNQNFLMFWNNTFAGHQFAKDVVEQSLKDVGIDMTKVIRTERKQVIGEAIAKYPASYNDFPTQYGEAFAELYSDEDINRPIKKAFDKVLKQKMNELYGGKK